MQNEFVTVVVGWMATVCLIFVAYLISLMIEERRRNRRMNAKRSRVGLSA